MIQADNAASEVEAKAGETSRSADLLGLEIPPLELQPTFEPGESKNYQLNELLGYHDRAFVIHLYAVLLKRAPTADELASTVDDLRSGRRTKIEIADSVSAARRDGPAVIQVEGLSSPVWRRVKQWPVIGYGLRMFAALIRLPKLIKDQQRFEAYALGQQQYIADYLNQVLTPTILRRETELPVIANLSATVADALESLLMLSESLMALSARYEEFEAGYQAEQAQHAARHLEIERVQTEQQQAIDQTQHAHATTAAAQQEFLIQEQRVIVETQKAVLAEFQRQLDELRTEHREKLTEFDAQLRELQSPPEAKAARAVDRKDSKLIAPKSRPA